MPITFVNVGTEGQTASGNVTLGAPASPQVNDVWIAAVHTANQSAHTFTDWTQIFQENGGTVDRTNSRLSVWWFRYAGSTPNLTVTHAGADGSPGGGIAAFRGCKTSESPVNTLGTKGEGTDATIEILGITPSVPDCMLVAIDGAGDDNARTVVPSGFTAAFEDFNIGGSQFCFLNSAGAPDNSVALYWKIHTSGPTGDFAATQAVSDSWISILLALEPDAPAPPAGGPTTGSLMLMGKGK